MIMIDGSQGEGGGQILRSSLALSLVTGQSFRMVNIRARRPKPGLMRQHLIAVRAAAKIGNAAIEGDSIGNLELSFKPGKVEPGNYAFAVGTAGSASLVLQTILPALLTASGRTILTLEGGTHNPFAPPWDFLVKSFLPLINRMGPHVETKLIKHGFYPAGGGKFQVAIDPSERLTGIELPFRREIKHRCARALISNLSPNIAHRELKVVADSFNWSRDLLHFEEIKDAIGPGNVIMIELGSETVNELFTGFGEQGTLAEAVAEQAILEVKRYLASEAPIGRRLADQLMIPFALARKGNYLTMPLSQHSKTNLEVIGKFIDSAIRVERTDNSNCFLNFG